MEIKTDDKCHLCEKVDDTNIIFVRCMIVSDV